MPTPAAPLPIQRAVWLDAVVSLPAGLLALLLAAPLSAALGAPTAAVIGVASFAALYGAAMFPLSRRARPSARWPWILVVGNALWVIASVLLAVSSWIQPRPAGLALLLAQAAVVAVLCALQLRGMRQAGPVAPA